MRKARSVATWSRSSLVIGKKNGVVPQPESSTPRARAPMMLPFKTVDFRKARLLYGSVMPRSGPKLARPAPFA